MTDPKMGKADERQPDQIERPEELLEDRELDADASKDVEGERRRPAPTVPPDGF